MRSKPRYFERIREKASGQWKKLEADVELAAPWHQLFKQVQSPRHILSELLQNADDAGATNARVRIDNDVFIFEHDGEDFTEEHFGSLCRFGYSNKRALHTIGFRGIGFKSTFSLGDRVELITPTLATAFERRRFTEPTWLTEEASIDRTQVRVRIKDSQRRTELERNLTEWLQSPVSLLFFRSIRRVQIGDRDVHWGSLGPGPITDSEWMALYNNPDDARLLVRSASAAFPSEALEEIKLERMLGVEDDAEFPPCKIELVVGAEGTLYVVLPTGVRTELPFACNAPFIQDPARLKIKDPEISPTNKWLLERAGDVAASAMLAWLQGPSSVKDRASAYGLLPDIKISNNSLESTCGIIAEQAFVRAIENRAFLLTDSGDLVPERQCVRIPAEVQEVWPAASIATILDDAPKAVLSEHVAAADRAKLVRWGLVEDIDKTKLLDVLQLHHMVRPGTWAQLLALWTYLAPELTDYLRRVDASKVRILPVQGQEVLYSAAEIVRLGEKKLLQSDDDWEFLAKFLLVLNANWPRHLAEQRRRASELGDKNLQRQVDSAYAVLDRMGLQETSDASKVIARVASDFFSAEERSIGECVQLAQIAAALDATAHGSFRFVTRDERIRPVDSQVLFDLDGSLEELLTQHQSETKLLHPQYGREFRSCTHEDWQRWVDSGHAGLLTFLPLQPKRNSIYGRRKAQQEAEKRGAKNPIYFPYTPQNFVLEDWDFDEITWSHWRNLAADDDRLWTRVVDKIAAQRDDYWNRTKTARLLQVATTGSEKATTLEPLSPGWLRRLRELPCLRDTRGIPREPAELFRRTAETEPLMDVEPFVHAHLDTEKTRSLLDLLGVRSTPTGPDRLLERLRSLALAENPPTYELEKWYRRLDQVIANCSSDDFNKIKIAFQNEKLIRTQDNAWGVAAFVFLMSDESDVPGAATILPSVADLSLWRKVGVVERPTTELALQWLRSLSSDHPLSSEDATRVRSLMARHPVRVWEECRHWMNLAGDWVPIESLVYSLSLQTLIPWSNLHPWVKDKTADLQRLPVEVTRHDPFVRLTPLVAEVTENIQTELDPNGRLEPKDWLVTVGRELQRFQLEGEEGVRVRELAETLSRTRWQPVRGLSLLPYIDGVPAGTARRADVLWQGQLLYVDQLPKAKLAKRVPEEIGKAFGRQDIKAALDYSFERTPHDVQEYLEENFSLGPRQTFEPAGDPQETSAIVNTHSSQTSPPGAASDASDDRPSSVPSASGEVNAENDGRDPDLVPEVIVANTVVRIHEVPHGAKESLMERFLKREGFRKESEASFFRHDGSRIHRAQESQFPWERRNAVGFVVRHYWPKQHCLEQEPLQVPAEVWDLLQHEPDEYALILTDTEGDPVEVTGAALMELRESGTLTLFPATYRIVHCVDRQ